MQDPALDRLREELQKLRKSGEKTVATEALIRWIDEAASDRDFDLAHFKMLNQSQLAQYRAENERALEMFRSVMASGDLALRAAMLLNGGAAIAALAFIGNIWTDRSEMIGGLADSLLVFAFGVLAPSMAAGARYLAQFYYGREFLKLGNGFNVLSVLLVLTSYGLFCRGLFVAQAAITR